MSNILEKKLSILDRLPSACRMRDRDTAGGRIDPHDKHKSGKNQKNTTAKIGIRIYGIEHLCNDENHWPPYRSSWISYQ